MPSCIGTIAASIARAARRVSRSESMSARVYRSSADPDHSCSANPRSPAFRCATAPRQDNHSVPTLTFAPLLHLLGFLTGAALYALLLAMVGRKFDYLALLTAGLGLLWNVIGLADYAIRDFAGREPSAWLVATAYSALGFLPAVVVHSVLRGRDGASPARAVKIVVAAAYIISTAAET